MTAVRGVADALARVGQTATRLASGRPPGAAEARPAWDAWHAGDFAVAREHAAGLVAAGQAVDEAEHLLALVACVLGEYDEAIATHRLIDPRYRRLAELDEPVMWAHVHRDDIAGALAFAERRGLDRRGPGRGAARTAAPPGAGEPARGRDRGRRRRPVHGRRAHRAHARGRRAPERPADRGPTRHGRVVRPRDGGGGDAFGVKAVVSEREFGALGWHTVRHGFADLELGPIHLRNVPVAVHEGALPTGPIAEAFGVELGPIIGTNVLERFLTTIDTPRRRLILSRRGDGDAPPGRRTSPTSARRTTRRRSPCGAIT